MTDQATSYSDILDFSKDKVPEGDYIKICNFFKTLHENKTEPENRILDTTNYELNLVLEYDSFNDKHHTIKIDILKVIEYTGAKPNDYHISGSFDGRLFDVDADLYAQRCSRVFDFYGIKNIKRSIYDCEVQEFKTLRDFKEYCQKRIEASVPEDWDCDDIYSYSGESICHLLLGTKLIE